MAGADLVGTKETQSAHHGLRADDLSHLRLDAETILHHEHDAIVFDDRRQQLGQQMILCCLEADAHDVAFRHVAYIAIGVHFREGEVAVLGFADQSVLAHVFVIAVQQEMQFTTGVLQSRAIEPSQRTCADNGIAPLHSPKVST